MKKKLNCILIIDDDHSFIFLSRRILHKADVAHQIQVAKNGKEALEYLKNCKSNHNPYPELIFLDINMPVMDGWDFLEEFEKLPVEIRERPIVICMLTVSLNDSDRQRAEANSYVKGFLSKPLTVSALNEVMQNYFSEYY